MNDEQPIPCVEHQHSQLDRRASAWQFLQYLFWLAIGRYWDKAHQAKIDERDAWSGFTTYAQACERTALYLLEFRPWWPSYDGPPNPETHEIARELAHANRAGLLTHGSQPGGSWEDGWVQRAAVMGFCDGGVRMQLEELFANEPAVALVFYRTADYRKVNYEHAVVVTERFGVAHTTFGAALPQKQLDFDFGSCTSELLDHISGLWQVTIVDTRWGDERLIWDALLKLEVSV